MHAVCMDNHGHIRIHPALASKVFTEGVEELKEVKVVKVVKKLKMTRKRKVVVVEEEDEEDILAAEEERKRRKKFDQSVLDLYTCGLGN